MSGTRNRTVLKLKAARVNKGLFQEDVAKLLGCTLLTYQYLESGKSNLKLETALRLVEILGVDSITDIEWPKIGRIK